MSELPGGAKLLIACLAASPILQAVCVATQRGFLNFGGSSWWNFFIYWAIAPVVAALLALRHERARFSVYVFLSCEAYRGVKIHSLPLVALSALAIVYLQTPAARAAYPRIDPAAVRRRIRGYVAG